MLIDELPADNFNIVVENDMDRARLLWLVNKIGESKLRKSAAKYQARYPGSLAFVSTILGWYGLKVPTAVYLPVRIPVYWLYLLYRVDGSEVKVGMTGAWPERAFAQVPSHHKVSDFFDLDLSRAFLIGGNKVEVRRRESMIKKRFSPWRSRPSHGWNNSYTEWFIGNQLDELVAMASSFDDEKHTVVQTLGQAVEIHLECLYQELADAIKPFEVDKERLLELAGYRQFF